LIPAPPAGLAFLKGTYALSGTIGFGFLLIFHGSTLLSTVGLNPPAPFFHGAVAVIAYD
jgi:hypothetical protein